MTTSDYSKYLAQAIRETSSYSEYLSDSLNHSVVYSDYLSQEMDRISQDQGPLQSAYSTDDNDVFNKCKNMRHIKSFDELTRSMPEDEEDFFCTPELGHLTSEESWIKEYSNKHAMRNSATPEKTFDEIAAETTQPRGQKVNFNFESVSENGNDPIL